MTRPSFFRALPWAILDSGGAAAIGVITLLILSKVLTPTELGVVAFAQAIVGFVQIFAGAGLNEAIVQRKQIDAVHQHSVFWASSAFGLSGFLLCAAIAWVLFSAGHDPVLCIVLTVEGCALLFFGFNLLPTAMLMRELRTSELAKRTLLSRIAYLICAVALAYQGFGIWSIVVAYVFHNIVGTITLWIGYQYRPRYLFSPPHLKHLILFGAPVMLESVLWATLTRVFNILLGSFHGLEILGAFSMASKATDAIANVLLSICGRFGLPVLSTYQDDLATLKKMFMKATEAIVFVSAPLFLGMLLTAAEWVPLFLGEKWTPAIPMIQILCASWVIVFTRMFAGTSVRAVGNATSFLMPAFVAAVATILAVIATARMDVIFAVYGWVARILITAPLGAWLLLKYTGIGYVDQLKPLLRPALCCWAMLTAAVLCRYLIRLHGLVDGHLPTLLLTALVGAGIYAASAAILYHKTARSLLIRFFNAAPNW